jgi:hypothetical protein
VRGKSSWFVLNLAMLTGTQALAQQGNATVALP